MRLWVFGALLFSAQTLSAEEVEVRAGAHDGFTRLVFHVATSTKRHIIPERAGLRFVFPEHSGGFDTSSIYTRINRNRVAGVIPGVSELYIELSCQCIYETFSVGDSMIVLDIFEDTTTIKPVQSSPFVSLPRDEGETAVVVVGNEAFQEFKRNREHLLLEDFRYYGAFGGGVKSSIMQERLLREVQLTAFGNGFDVGIGESIPFVSSRAPFRVGSPFDGINIVPNVRVMEDRFDESFGNMEYGQLSVLIAGPHNQSDSRENECEEAIGLDMNEWVSSADFSKEVVEKLKTLYSDVDRMDLGTLVELAKVYLYFGFSIEARNILSLDTSPSGAKDVLSAISEVLQYGYSQRPGAFKNYLGCSDEFLLWAYLASRENEYLFELSKSGDKIIRAFDRLPVHLKVIVWPYLSASLLAHGNDDYAATALRSLTRGAFPVDSEAKVAVGNVAMAQGSMIETKREFSEVASSNSIKSINALLKLINSGLWETLGDTDDLRTLLLSYSKELNDDAVSIDVRREQVYALAHVGLFREAFDALLRLTPYLSDVLSAEMKGRVIEIFVKNADDVDFLSLVLSNELFQWENLPSDTSLPVASRLLDNGFPEQAESILNKQEEGLESTQASLLNARISLALSKPHAALAYISDLTSVEAVKIRMEANLALGRYEEVFSIYQSEIVRLDLEVDEEIRDLIQSLLSTIGFNSDSTPESDDAIGIVERSKKLVLESANSRESFETLLALTEGSQDVLSGN